MDLLEDLKMSLSNFNFVMLRYFNFEPSLKLRWCRARDLFGPQIPVTTGGFELRISCIQSRYDFANLLHTKSSTTPSQ